MHIIQSSGKQIQSIDSDRFAQFTIIYRLHICCARPCIEIPQSIPLIACLWKNMEYNILMTDMEKRKELKDLVIGATRPKQRHHKICIKIQKHRKNSGKNQTISPLFRYGFYFFQKQEDFQYLYSKIRKEINYAVHKLYKPDAFLIECKKIRLQLSKQKLLLLDLDETLIYSSEELEDPDFELFHKNFYLKLNIRPYCSVFLKNLSEVFDIFVFTSATIGYAEPIVKFLNSGKGYIKGILHREHCLKTKNGLFIKDLRIIQNVQIKNIVIVDNKIHSFSFQLNNGIPIQQFQQNRNDKVLISLEKFLIDLSHSEDIPQFLAQRLSLLKIAEESLQNKSQEIETSLRVYNFHRRKYQKNS